MLYLNAYEVCRAYGGPEEGGWWYDAGEPLASIPIRSIRMKGMRYIVVKDGVTLSECHGCQGTGEVEQEDLNGEIYIGPCEDCGEVPEDLAVASAMMVEYRAMLEDEVGRDETLVMALEDHMAHPFPEQRPRYE